MKQRLEGNSALEFILLSGHDNTIMALLSHLGIRDWPIPQFASYIAFELRLVPVHQLSNKCPVVHSQPNSGSQASNDLQGQNNTMDDFLQSKQNDAQNSADEHKDWAEIDGLVPVVMILYNDDPSNKRPESCCYVQIPVSRNSSVISWQEATQEGVEPMIMLSDFVSIVHRSGLYRTASFEKSQQRHSVLHALRMIGPFPHAYAHYDSSSDTQVDEEVESEKLDEEIESEKSDEGHEENGQGESKDKSVKRRSSVQLQATKQDEDAVLEKKSFSGSQLWRRENSIISFHRRAQLRDLKEWRQYSNIVNLEVKEKESQANERSESKLRRKRTHSCGDPPQGFSPLLKKRKSNT